MKKKFAVLFIILIVVLCSACNNGELKVRYYRKVARETLDNGWVYTFVNEGNKSKFMDDSDLIKYSFYGINIRYKYDDAYIKKIVRIPESERGGDAYTEITVPPVLIFGEGSQAQEDDMELISKILDSKNSVEDLLALNPDDYEFKEVDKEMFFRLMRTALTGEPQKESKDITYWEKPSYAFFNEQTYIDGYKFQIAFLQETGCVDELYIDVLYKTGDGYKDYVQLSDLIDSNTATEEQKQVFDMIKKITSDIKEQDIYIANADDYKDKVIGNIDFSRLYIFLNNIHENHYDQYLDGDLVIKTEKGTNVQ